MSDEDDPLREDDDRFEDDFDPDWDDEAIGCLPDGPPYGPGLEDEIYHDPNEGLPPEKAAARRAMLGVPDFDDEDEDSPTRAVQDALINRVNDILEDEWEWDAAAEVAYEALAIDPTYPRAANALLRCYLTHNTLREMEHALIKLFDPGSQAFNQSHRVLEYSYRVLSRADFWLEWLGEIPPELDDVKDLLEGGHSALNHAYFSGKRSDYQKARSLFDAALKRYQDRTSLMWFLARQYADKGYFADSAALLGALIASGSTRVDVQRLYAEMLWWRDHSRWLPWVH